MLHIPAFRLSNKVLLLNLSIRHSQQLWPREQLLGQWRLGSPCTVRQISSLLSTWEHGRGMHPYRFTVGLAATKACLMSGGCPSPTAYLQDNGTTAASIAVLHLQSGALALSAQQFTVLWSEPDTQHVDCMLHPRISSAMMLRLGRKTLAELSAL